LSFRRNFAQGLLSCQKKPGLGSVFVVSTLVLSSGELAFEILVEVQGVDVPAPSGSLRTVAWYHLLPFRKLLFLLRSHLDFTRAHEVWTLCPIASQDAVASVAPPRAWIIQTVQRQLVVGLELLPSPFFGGLYSLCFLTRNDEFVLLESWEAHGVGSEV
jgi:hypothetical protein